MDWLTLVVLSKVLIMVGRCVGVGDGHVSGGRDVVAQIGQARFNLGEKRIQVAEQLAESGHPGR